MRKEDEHLEPAISHPAGIRIPSNDWPQIQPYRERERLRIGIIAPPWFAIPPDGYGGIERVVSYLADGLAARGHDVTLFAAGTSRTAARMRATFATPQPALIGDVPAESWHVMQATRRHREFDVMHDHTRLGLIALDGRETPVVHTMHGLIRPQDRLLYEDLGANAHLVAISNNQRSHLPTTDAVTVIHNAVDLKLCPFGETPGDYLLFVGRMNPDKGIVEAIEIARRTNRRLVIIAKLNEPAEREYFGTTVEPLLASVDYTFLEQPAEAVKLSAYAGALATLFPIQWDEPFGLVMIESMAAGTPVIAFRRGSVPEVIADGETGFIVDDVDAAAAAVARVSELDRSASRQRVHDRFSVEASVEQHERLFRRLATGRATADRLSPAVTNGGYPSI